MGTISEMDEKGYLNLKLLKADGRKKKLLHSPAYKRKKIVSELLINIIYVKKYTGLYQTKAACFQYKIKECDGACIGMVSEEYNLRVSAFITNNSFENQNGYC
jgi:DNA polymerase-3 subunit epsilon